MDKPAASSFDSHRLQGLPLFVAWILLGGIILLILILYALGLPKEYAAHILAGQDFLPNLSKLGLSVEFYAIYRTFLDVLMAVAFILIGSVIFWQKPDDRMVLLIATANIGFGSLFVPTLLQIIRDDPTLAPQVGFVRALGLCMSLIVLYYLFPDGRFVPRWTRWLAVIWAGLCVGWFLFPQMPANLVYLDSWQQHMALSYTTFLLAYGSGIWAQFYRFRHILNPIQRQQTKWVVLGTTTAFLGFILYNLPFLLLPIFNQPTFPRLIHILVGVPIYHLMILAAPIALSVSIIRFRLWDIDWVINRSLVSGSLSLILAMVYFVVVVAGGRLLERWFGQSYPLLMTALSTLLVAILFNPLRRTLQQAIDRRFYPRKYDAARTLEWFAGVARSEVDLDSLTNQVLQWVADTLETDQAVLWIAEPPPAASRAPIGDSRILEPGLPAPANR